MVVVIDRWSLLRGGRKLRFDCISKMRPNLENTLINCMCKRPFSEDGQKGLTSLILLPSNIRVMSERNFEDIKKMLWDILIHYIHC